MQAELAANAIARTYAGLFHSHVQFAIAVFPKPLPVSKTGVFKNFCLLTGT
ncbi:MAG: hypothetical protein QQW96_11710 [Tychonema bourrellyi B0820]|uniref:hypothetical protein n=1 Tax=Tychonema bourrellyi TaxID=54313 RepID=UPI0015D4EAE5|nr:hypothetical protein [Tychonema bourrellyi]MDQ2098302.1 hypothetical protein [Tychonema bourrellyi B0820]